MKLFFYMCVFSIVLLSGCSGNSTGSANPPYPDSQHIMGIEFLWNTHDRRAEGSDNWPITWAKNNNQYTTWGDGGGFGGSNSKGRVSLGTAIIKGNSDSYQGENFYGGYEGKYNSQIDGKSYGIIDLDSTLYMWISPGSDIKGYDRAILYSSINSGASWSAVKWSFEKSEGLIFPTFLQFGKGYEKSLDDFVYIYAISLKRENELSIQKPGKIFLMRVLRSKLLERKEYWFYAGEKNNGEPLWSIDLEAAIPVFKDAINGVGWTVSVSYNRGLDRYFLTTEHTESFKSNMGIYDSPSPWGPWSTVYFGKFGKNHIQETCFFYNFSNKWLSSDGQSFSLIFSGIKSNDSFNAVNGRFLIK